MIILGLDPGTATTGYGILKVNDKKYKVLDYGLIQTEKNGESGNRLVLIYKKITKIILKNKPDVVAIEKLFFASNAKTAMSVGQAQGVMLFCAAKTKTKVYEYAPAKVKKIISGNGRADKKLIQKSLRKVLGFSIRSKPKKKTHFDNAADALAVALTHALIEKDKKLVK